jgi:hypothetical protein
MIRLFLLITSVLIGFLGFGQFKPEFISTKATYEVYTTNFSNSKNELKKYIDYQKIKIINQDESKKFLKLKLEIDELKFKSLDSLMSKLGYVVARKISTENKIDKVNQLNLELDYLLQKKSSYLDRMKQLDDQSDAYRQLWVELKQIEDRIFLKQSEILALGEKDHIYNVQVDLVDEYSITDDTKVSFINMPGFEYSYLQIQNPISGISAQNYNGYFLKYLFTEGKSYALLGAFQNKQIEKTDTLALSELFVLGFGQDFYSRYLGRGGRKYLNLYSGYQLGGILGTSKSVKSNMFYIAPVIGLEIFKNNYLLIDANMRYFVPLKDTKYLRGLSYNLSLNFVF